jgi:hypothetical protein
MQRVTFISAGMGHFQSGFLRNLLLDPKNGADIQSVPGGEINILEDHYTGHSKQKSVNLHVFYSEQYLK